MNVLYLAAEVAPLVKVGGLGDVSGGLPRSLVARGHDVRVVVPAYKQTNPGRYGFQPAGGPHGLHNGGGEHWFGVLAGDLAGVTTYLIQYDALFGRDQVYGYWDDPYRFIFLCQAALAFARDTGFRPDVVHAHDWHTAFAVAWLNTAGRVDSFYRRAAGVLTIHNARHQGRSAYDSVRYGGLAGWLPALMPWEAWGEVNWLARGVLHADALNAVSPRYASEIASPEGGWGLESLYRMRRERLTGILNGIDVTVWNPATDPQLAANYTAETLDMRAENKRALQAAASLAEQADAPMLAFVGRLDAQKGVDYMLPALEYLLDTQDVQFVLLGAGTPDYERRLGDLVRRQPGKVRLFLEFNAGLAPLVYAGCDIFLMPSLFEPCGLGQMIAMRYGAVPVVRATGGLVDTVLDTDPSAAPPVAGTGFRFRDADQFAVGWALDRALQTYRHDPALWRQIQLRGMAQDFSWERAAGKYEELYVQARRWHG